MAKGIACLFESRLWLVLLHVVLFKKAVDNISMVSVGSLVKLKYKTLSTIFDKDRGLVDCWLEIENPGIIMSINRQSPVQVCDIAFGSQIFYGIACEDIEVMEEK